MNNKAKEIEVETICGCRFICIGTKQTDDLNFGWCNRVKETCIKNGKWCNFLRFRDTFIKM